MDNDVLNQTKEISKVLLEKLKVELKDLNVEKDESDVVHIKIDTDETGILIGYHGETLYALQFVISLMLYKQTGAWHRITLNVGDYQEKREQSIISMAQRAVEKVMATQKPVALYNLAPSERRIIHLYLEENQDVASTSEGEGGARRLVISPRSEVSENNTSQE